MMPWPNLAATADLLIVAMAAGKAKLSLPHWTKKSLLEKELKTILKYSVV